LIICLAHFNSKTMHKLVAFFFVLLFLTAAQPTLAQNNDDTRWTIDDIIHTEYVRNVTFAPDGQALIWTKRRAFEKKDKFISDIYLTRLDLKKDGLPRTFRMTSRDENDHSPIFSRDGETIYFLSSRDKGKKLWKMSIYGGEPQAVHEFKNGIRNLQWLDDHTLAYLSHDGKTLYNEENKKDDTKIIDDSLHWQITRVYAYDFEEETSRRLTDNTHPVTTYAVAKNGRYLVVHLQMSPHYGVDGKPKPQVYLYDIANNHKTRILPGYQTPGSFSFTADNRGFYFTAVTSSDPEWEGAGIRELYYYSLEAGNITKVDLAWGKGISGGFVVAGNSVVASLANNTTRRLAFYKKTGRNWAKQALDFGVMNDHLSLLAIDEQGKKLAVVYSTASHLPEFRVADLDVRKKDLRISSNSEFVKLNKKLHKRSITKAEVVTWTGANNETVDGILYYPENYEAGKKYPLVLSIHGGPTGVDTDSWSERWSTYPQIMAQRGAFVLKPNYHGSGNHGLAFMESIKGHYYDLEEIDIIKGIKMLAAKGMVDMDKLGAMGWSNGAILTTMLTLRYPDMFKVAAAGAGDVNWTSDYGTCAFGVTFDQSYFGGAPWDDKDGKTYNETYIIKSPLFEIEKIKTPTIIFHGSEDRAVPRDQGWEYYRGLQQVGIAPVRFLWFPGQPHGLQKITHQKRKMKEELIWFDTYLFNSYKPENEALKKESPLARVLYLSEHAVTHEGLYGQWAGGILAPQVVPLGQDSISIGLFEMTNAQVATLLPGYTYPAGQENYPATGLGKAEIEQCLAALHKHTGKDYRLPNATEARALQKKAQKIAKEENTLNYWAGYALTLSDANRLSKKAAGSKLTLLMEAGRFKPAKLANGARVYDLGGNAAEYYLADGHLKTYGYSAYDFVDDYNPAANPQPAHTGFRVVRE